MQRTNMITLQEDTKQTRAVVKLIGYAEDNRDRLINATDYSRKTQLTIITDITF